MTGMRELVELVERLKALDKLFVDLYNYADRQSKSFVVSEGEANALVAIKNSIGNRYNVIPQAASAIDSLSSQVAELNWRPIETAPHDGTRVFLWLPHIEATQHERRIETFWMGYYWANEYGNGNAYNAVARLKNGYLTTAYESIQPSHWMPVPEPASSELKSSQD